MAVVAIGKRVPIVLTTVRSTLTNSRRRRYLASNRDVPIDGKLVVFSCYGGRGYSCSPAALYREMRADPAYADYEFVWAFTRRVSRALAERGFDVQGMDEVGPPKKEPLDLEYTFGDEALAELRGATIVAWRTKPYHRAFGRAGVWITNSILPVYLAPREGQRLLQTWHGTPLKRLGCDIKAEGNAVFTAQDIWERYDHEGARLAHLISPSAFATEKLGSAFNLEALGKTDAIIEQGYPRNDALATFGTEQVAAARERIGIPEGKKAILYAPTFRDDQHTSGVGYTFDLGVDFERLRDALGDEYVVLFRAHYLVRTSFDFEHFAGFVIDVSEINDINDLYIVSDVLVTDYSSVFFDYANLDRPIVFYMYDLEAYVEDLRGIYLDLDELPGPIVRTVDELLGELVSAVAGPTEWDDRRRDFRTRFTYLDDGRASERTLRRLFGSAGQSASTADGEAELDRS